MDAIDRICKFLRLEAGLDLQPGQEHFANLRLAPVIRQTGLADLSALASRVEAEEPAVRRAVVEAMVTHETSFFRDRSLFTFFEEAMLPALVAARAEQRRLRIWSGACSTGQEPYSIAMMLDEHARDLAGWWIEIAATDLSGKAIDTARRGRYSQFEVQRGLSAPRLLRYFTRTAEDWQVAEHLRERIRFTTFNLMNDPGVFGPCDVIFCRNVFLYLDPDTVRLILGRLAAILAPDGFLVIGGSETVLGLTDQLVPHPQQPGVLVRRDASLAQPMLELAAV